MEFEVKEFEKIEDGQHAGVISKVEYRTEPYKYTDVYIKLDNDIELKYGCPSNIMKDNKLGRLLSRFTDLEAGKMVDPERVLLGKRVSFMSINKKSGEKEFTNIVDDSIKPFVVEEAV